VSPKVNHDDGTTALALTTKVDTSLQISQSWVHGHRIHGMCAKYNSRKNARDQAISEGAELGPNVNQEEAVPALTVIGKAFCSFAFKAEFSSRRGGRLRCICCSLYFVQFEIRVELQSEYKSEVASREANSGALQAAN